ncbi:zinc finger BED domain-containing protein 6-like [Cotesia glomerata]|uniref:zinc finger BED domain-containing protein 6-like n=1 Tax=Cotesia glomerata TaxID=32391 RepID=UPI001D002728|nr:zinc finger BED domain-containing protein 6-like [Cotesia glomerata]
MSSQDYQEESMNVDLEPDIEITEGNETLPSTQRSAVWTYFKLCTKEFRKAICNTCSAVLKLPTSTTSPMLKHLLSRHPDLHSKCLEARNKRKIIEDNNNVDESSKRSKLAPISKAEFDQLCMEMIAIDLKPFSCVEDKSFRRLLSRLDNTYDPPSRTTCSRSLCPDLYNRTKQELMNKLKSDIAVGLMKLSFTTDGWKSRSGHHYLSFTVHYMTNNSQLKNIMLGIRQFEDRHTAVNIKSTLEDMMSEWDLLDLPNIPIFFTTDNAANITSAIRHGGWHHVYCFAHTPQLVIKDSQKHTEGIDELLNKTRRIATYFHHLDPARRDLENAQKTLSDEPPLKLIQMVKHAGIRSSTCLNV